MAEYNMPQYILREFKVTDARVSAAQRAVCACKGNSKKGVGWGGSNMCRRRLELGIVWLG